MGAFRTRAFLSLVVPITLLFLPYWTAVGENELAKVCFKKDARQVEILIGDRCIAKYVYVDSAIPRPYFCEVSTVSGTSVTRPNPPDPVINNGNDDHPTFHPGIWLAFGDLGGQDFWRNKAKVRHVRFVDDFVEKPGMGKFSVENEYVGDAGNVVCHETCLYSIHADAPTGYFLTSVSTFRSDNDDLAFGDQEEMGLGVRLNTPLTGKFGTGKIVNSEGCEGEKETWGKSARWCASTGVLGDKAVTIAVMPASANFRPSWFHTREYGLIVANPFGRKAMTGPDDPAMPTDSTAVKRGEAFTMGFGIWVSEGPPGSTPSIESAYERCVKLMEHDQ